VFKAFNKGRVLVSIPVIERISLMADAAGAITNGIEEADITIIVRGMCWFHCKKSIDKQIVKIKNLDKKSDIIQCICILQLSQTPAIFFAATKLFLNQYYDDEDEDVSDFLEYFKSEWIDINSHWYEGYNNPNNAGSTSNNNGNESINGLIKREDTLRNLLSLNSFIAVAFGILRKWSFGRDTINNVNAKVFAEEPTISLSQWTEAYNWKKTAIIGQDLDTNKNNYYFKSGNSVEIITLEVIRKYDELIKNCKWNNWAEFKNCAFGIWRVTMPDQLTDLNWKKGLCTCPTFYKKYLCKHIIGIALRLNSITKAALLMPLTAKDILISSKRKVGRPALAKRALLRQPLQSILQADEIDDEIEAIDDDIEYNEQQYSQIIEYQRMQQYIDNEYTLRFNNPMDCSMTNPFDYIDTNNDMFGLMRKTTSVSTPDIINTISHISNIEESSESPTFTTLTSFNTLPSASTTITTQVTLSLTASNEERLLLKRENKETDNIIPKKKPGRLLRSFY